MLFIQRVVENSSCLRRKIKCPVYIYFSFPIITMGITNIISVQAVDSNKGDLQKIYVIIYECC